MKDGSARLLHRGWGRARKRTYCKQDEVLLVVLADTVIDPGTVVVHLPNTPLTNAARPTRQTLRGCQGSRGPAEQRTQPLVLLHAWGLPGHCPTMARGVARGWEGRVRTPRVPLIPNRGQSLAHKAPFLV